MDAIQAMIARAKRVAADIKASATQETYGTALTMGLPLVQDTGDLDGELATHTRTKGLGTGTSPAAYSGQRAKPSAALSPGAGIGKGLRSAWDELAQIRDWFRIMHARVNGQAHTQAAGSEE